MESYTAAVNGIIAWAALPLRAGAYAAMDDYIDKSQEYADGKWKKAVAGHKPDASKEEKKDIPGNDYNALRFNCMTFCLCVYEIGNNPKATLKPNLED